MSAYQKSIGKENAIALCGTEWWKGKSFREITRIGLFTKELCLPFDILHEAVEKSLGRPVFTHEFGLNFDGICQEFLGEKDAPSFEEIIGLIPKEKLIVVSTP